MRTTTEQGYQKQLLQNTVSCNHSVASSAVSDGPLDEIALHAQGHQLFEVYATRGHLHTENYALLARSIVITMPQESRTEEDQKHYQQRGLCCQQLSGNGIHNHESTSLGHRCQY